MSSSNCCFLTYIQVSQEAGQVVWYSHIFQNFPQFIVIHTVKGFGMVNEVEIDVFLELSSFFHIDGHLVVEACGTEELIIEVPKDGLLRVAVRYLKNDLLAVATDADGNAHLKNQLEHQEVHGSHIAEAWLGEF